MGAARFFDLKLRAARSSKEPPAPSNSWFNRKTTFKLSIVALYAGPTGGYRIASGGMGSGPRKQTESTKLPAKHIFNTFR